MAWVEGAGLGDEVGGDGAGGGGDWFLGIPGCCGGSHGVDG